MVVHPARSRGRGLDGGSRRHRTVVLEERPRRPAHPDRRRSRQDRSPSRGRSPRSPVRHFRDERQRRLPPGFSRRGRTASPPPPQFNHGASCEVDRNRLVEDVPLLPGGVDLAPIGRGGTYGAVIPDADEKSGSALPPHMNARQSVRDGNEIGRLGPPHDNLRRHDAVRMDGPGPMQNPLMVAQMPMQNPNLLALDKPNLMPRMLELPKNPLAMDNSQIGLSQSGMPQNIFHPRRDSPPSRIRARDSPIRDARRRSATPVLDVSVLSNGGEGGAGKQSARPTGQTGKKDEGRMFMKDVRPKKKQKQSEGRRRAPNGQKQGTSTQREWNRWAPVDDKLRLHVATDVNPSAPTSNPPISTSLSQSRPVSSDQYIAELRLLLAERMHQALETAASKGHGDCGILEESVGIDYNGRFGRMLNVIEAGFPTVREMIRSTCLDIVQMQQLRAGEVVKMGYIPTPSIKAEAGMVLAGVREAYSKLVAGSSGVSQGNQAPEGKVVEMQNPSPMDSASAGQIQQKPPPFMLAKMAKNMLRSIMRDIVSEVWPSVTIPQFLGKFKSHYSLNLEAKDLGYDSIKDFLSSQVESIVAFQEVDGVTHLVPSVKYLTEKPPVLAGLHGKKVVFLGSSSGQYRGAGGSGNLGQSNIPISGYHSGGQKSGTEGKSVQQQQGKTSSGLIVDGRNRGGMSRQEEDKLTHHGPASLSLPNLTLDRKTGIEGPLGPHSVVTEIASVGNDDKHGVSIPTRPGHPGEMYESILVGRSFPASDDSSRAPAPVAASSQQVSAPNPKEYSRLLLSGKALMGPSHVEALPKVLAKLSDLVKKHVVDSGTPVVLNRLPLLYFNEYRHVLDFMTLGFASLGDLVGLLGETVTIADSSSGKVLVPANTPSSVLWPARDQPTEVAGTMHGGQLPKSAPQHITLPSHHQPSPPLPHQMAMSTNMTGIQHPEPDATFEHGVQQAHNAPTALAPPHAPPYQYPPSHQSSYSGHGPPPSSQPVYANWNSPSVSEPPPQMSAPATGPVPPTATAPSYAEAYYQYQQQYQQYQQYHQQHAQHYPQHYQPQESPNQQQQQQPPQPQQQYSMEHGQDHQGHVYVGSESHQEESQQAPPVPTGPQHVPGAQQWETWSQYTQGGQSQPPVPHGHHPGHPDEYWRPQ